MTRLRTTSLVDSSNTSSSQMTKVKLGQYTEVGAILCLFDQWSPDTMHQTVYNTRLGELIHKTDEHPGGFYSPIRQCLVTWHCAPINRKEVQNPAVCVFGGGEPQGI